MNANQAITTESSAVIVSKRPSFIDLWKSSGPAWMACGLNIGGGTVTNSVLLAAATGYAYGWVFAFATFAIFMATFACVKLTVVTGKKPIQIIREDIHPFAGYAVGGAILIVNAVFHSVQVVLGALVLNTLIPVSLTFWGIVFVLLSAFFALYPSKGANKVAQDILKYIVYILSASYLISLFMVDVNWGDFFKGLFTITIPTSKNSVLLFTAVLGSALAINVPAIQAYSSKSDGMGPDKLVNFKFETVLTNVFLLFVQLSRLAVVAATLFKSGTVPKSAIQAALALEPVAGKFSTILFCLGLFGAVLSSMVAQSSINAYVFLDIMGWEDAPGSKRFKFLQAILLASALTVPLFQWNPLIWVSWGAAFNSSFMPLGIAAWWYLINKKIGREYKATIWVNLGMAIALVIAVSAAVRFWYVTLS